MRRRLLVPELGVVLGPHVRRRQHHVHVVRRERRCAFGPVVDNLEGDVESLVREDRSRRRLEPAVRDQTRGTADPDVDAHPHVLRLGRSRRQRRQRLAGVELVRLGVARALARGRRPLAEVEQAVTVEPVAHEHQADQEDQDPSALFDSDRHCILHPPARVLEEPRPAKAIV